MSKDVVERRSNGTASIAKAAPGIPGLDEITSDSIGAKRMVLDTEAEV